MPPITEDEAAAMFRAAVNLFSGWGVTDEQAAVLLDLPVRSYRRWKAGELGRIDRDGQARLSNIMGIHKALRIVFREPQRGYAWVKAPNQAFAGRTALGVVLGGELTELMRVARSRGLGRAGAARASAPARPAACPLRSGVPMPDRSFITTDAAERALEGNFAVSGRKERWANIGDDEDRVWRAILEAFARITTQYNGPDLETIAPMHAVVWRGIDYATGCAVTSGCAVKVFFCSDGHLQAWRSADPAGARGFQLSMEEGLQVGQAMFVPMLGPSKHPAADHRS